MIFIILPTIKTFNLTVRVVRIFTQKRKSVFNLTVRVVRILQGRVKMLLISLSVLSKIKITDSSDSSLYIEPRRGVKINTIGGYYKENAVRTVREKIKKEIWNARYQNRDNGDCETGTSHHPAG
jgi:hypothetical protein